MNEQTTPTGGAAKPPTDPKTADPTMNDQNDLDAEGGGGNRPDGGMPRGTDPSR